MKVQIHNRKIFCNRISDAIAMRALIILFSIFLGYNAVYSQAWTNVGGGMGGFVTCVLPYNNDLIVGGNFTSAGIISASRIARWNGTNWIAMGSGVSGAQNFVQALDIYNGNLWVGGNFTDAGGNPQNYVTRYNSSGWYPLPPGLGASAGVYDFQVYGPGNGELVMCGNFEFCGGNRVNYIVKWGGSSWSTLGSGMDQAGVYALTVYNNELIAGGNFHSAGGVPANNIARWNGSSWSPLGQGVSGGTLNVLALGVYNGQLYAGGDFTTAGGVSVSNLARWNGSSWSSCGSGVNNTVFVFYPRNGDLYVGGMFTTAGGTGVGYLARWTGTSWLALQGGSMNSWVRALGTYSNNFYAGGTFTSAGGAICLFIARTDQPLPVVLASFSSSVSKNNVILDWTTSEEINNRGFDIERRNLSGSWIKKGYVPGNGTTNDPKSYRYTDTRLQKGVYQYRLKQVDYNGNYEYHNLSQDVNIGNPGDFFVSQSYPNPSNPKCKIDYELPVSVKVAIKVHDFAGREVATLVNKIQDAGYYSAEFDGTNLASGIYFYTLLIDNKKIETKKMILIK